MRKKLDDVYTRTGDDVLRPRIVNLKQFKRVQGVLFEYHEAIAKYAAKPFYQTKK